MKYSRRHFVYLSVLGVAFYLADIKKVMISDKLREKYLAEIDEFNHLMTSEPIEFNIDGK